MAEFVSSTIDINATPQAVWDVLTDFPAYGDWNPYMDRVEGRLTVGDTLVVHMTPDGGLLANGGRGMTIKPTVLIVDPGRELRWRGRLGPGGLFDGEHSFVLGAGVGGATRLVHSERFTGILVPLLANVVRKGAAGYDAFNRACKLRVESPTNG